MKLKILSWNICWGCMESSKKSLNDRTAFKLAKGCYKEKKTKKKNICLDNVVDFLLKKNWDIICLQEATNWFIIYNKLKKYKKNLKYCVFTIKQVDICVFYNNTKMKIKAITGGNLRKSDIRPYQVIYFSQLDDKKQFILINLHNGHLIDAKTIEMSIDSNNFGFININNLKNMVLTDNIANVKLTSSFLINGKHEQSKSLCDIRKYNDNKPLIMIGDYNDHGKYNYWKTGINVFDSKVSSKNKKPPNTCCTPVSNPYLWLGAPSIINNPNLRKKIMGVDPTNMLFDITTFSSTACIREHENNLPGDLCKTYNSLKKHCNNTKYRSHESFSKKLKKFITKPTKIKNKILDEYIARKEYDGKNPYIRYNELLIYFYPWEVIGIEVGGRNSTISEELNNLIVTNREKYRKDYLKLLDKDNWRSLLNEINNNNTTTDLNYSEYSLWKFFKEYRCITNNIVSFDIFQQIVNKIINQLENKINYYEYGRITKKDNFSLFQIKLYNNKPYRITNFELFKQTADSNMLTHITNDRDLNTENKLPVNIKNINTESEFNFERFNKSNKYPLALRCLIIDKTTNNQDIDIKDQVSQIFNGKLFNNKIDIIANPSTIITPNTNVILTSQIYDRRYLGNKLIKHGNSYKSYGNSTVIPLRNNKFNNDVMIGDYILINNKVKYEINNSIPKHFNYNKLTSDHLPIESTIVF